MKFSMKLVLSTIIVLALALGLRFLMCYVGYGT